ncbi:hypothetical protein LWI29_019452 [Acer saccharum]|uniref:Gnk2-homologous domain-containing protein n=1 Tax=Acer saccharum TaxID=4024 RepID=A0AA39VGC9_ACESA|nr:hypothetical protein LWI29_019452 [Acer saccharum]
MSQLDGEPNYLYHLCPPDQNNTASDSYIYNVAVLFNQKLNNGGSRSIHSGEDPDTVYGLYLCRFDITADRCQNCIGIATKRLVKECKSSKTAIIWFDECMVRYSNRNSSFSTFETEPALYVWNPNNITQPDVFAEILNQTLHKAIGMLSASKYGTQNVSISNNKTLYSFVQCLPDLSIEHCRACLNLAVNRVLTQDSVKGKRGGRYLNPSCNTRYELDRFYGDPTPTVTAPAPNTPPNNSGNPSGEFTY